MYSITKNPEALAIIAQLDERANVEEVTTDGCKIRYFHEDYQSLSLYSIEIFVTEIKDGRDGGFIESIGIYGRRKMRELYLAKKYYRQLNNWIEQCSNIYRYSERVEVFYSFCREYAKLRKHPLLFGEPEDLASADGKRYMDVFNSLIEYIRDRCSSRQFTERERLRRKSAERRARNALQLERAMYSDRRGRARWLLLSLTLRYIPGCREEITPEMIQKHRDRFFAARRFNTLMSGIKNFVWAIEQGKDTGLHLHVILFYSPKHNHDEFIAKQIGEYWANVVAEGKGSYWNSNAGWLKRGYDLHGHGIGVGQINWKDSRKRRALRKNLLYLAKAEQYLMVKGAIGMHMFGMGQLPRKIKPGRPRVNVGLTT